MKRFKRLSLTLNALTAACLLVLVGCGIIGEKYKTIEWTTNYFEKYYPRWMNEFADAHADEKVQIKFRAMVSDAAQKVYTMLIADDLSDVIVVGTETRALLMDNEALEPIPDGLLNLDDFLPIGLSISSYRDGRLAAVPTGPGLRPYMYFNVDHLAEVGTTPEEVPETYDEYHKWAERFLKWELPDGSIATGSLPAEQAASAKVIRRPLIIQRAHTLSVFPFFLAYLDPEMDENGKSDGSMDDYLGGPPSNRPLRFDTPEFVAGVREWQKFFISDTGAIADGLTGRIKGLTNGSYSSCEAGNWIFGEVASVAMNVTAVPHAEGKPLRLPMTLASYGVSRNSKHKELALEFAKYISTTGCQMDAYYGHGYLPARKSAWKQIEMDDAEDVEIRARFLGNYAEGNGEFICLPRIKRTYRDRMELYLYVPYDTDKRLAAAASSDEVEIEAEESEEEAGAEGVEAAPVQLADRYSEEMAALARDVAAYTGQEVVVILQGTPEEMRPVRSVLPRSPVSVYVKNIDDSVYVPVDKLWTRLTDDVIIRVAQMVTHPDPAERMSPEEAGKWAQNEAQLILDGKK